MLKSLFLTSALSAVILFNAPSACAVKVLIIGDDGKATSTSTPSQAIAVKLKNESIEECQNRLKQQIPQPLLDTLLTLASPLGQNLQGSYLSHKDIFAFMDVYFPIKGYIVETTDWGRTLFYRPDVSDADLQEEGLTREEDDHFWEMSEAQFDTEMYKRVSQLPQNFRGKPTQVATYFLLQRYAARGSIKNFWAQTTKRYGAYQKFVIDIQQSNRAATELSFTRLDLTILPPSLSRLTGLTNLWLTVSKITDLGGSFNIDEASKAISRG